MIKALGLGEMHSFMNDYTLEFGVTTVCRTCKINHFMYMLICMGQTINARYT